MSITKIGGVEVNYGTPYTPKNSVSNKSSLENPIANGYPNDTMISISDAARDLLAKEEKLNFNDNAFNESELAQMLEQLRESSDPSNNPYMDKIKCLQIAMRIINGDKVPSKDRKFLMEKEPALYSQSILLSRKNDKPKKYKSLLDDEKSDAKTNQASPVSAQATAQAPVESEAGGASSDGEGEAPASDE